MNRPYLIVIASLAAAALFLLFSFGFVLRTRFADESRVVSDDLKAVAAISVANLPSRANLAPLAPGEIALSSVETPTTESDQTDAGADGETDSVALPAPSPAPAVPEPVRAAAVAEPAPAEVSAPVSRRREEERDPCNYRSLRIGAATVPEFKVANYVPTLQACFRPSARDAKSYAVRSMSIGGEGWLLLTQNDGLETTLERASCWTCEPATDESLKDTRLLQAVKRASQMPGVNHRSFLQNAGLRRGAARGDFVTGDLCPSNRPLDRRFFKLLIASERKPAPVALSISGLWLKSHETDFQWLQDLERAGVLEIVWVNHSYTHPYARRRPLDQTFMLTQNLNADFEILETERALISRGGVPSLFFRFPGLISSSPLMETLRRYHLIPLGAEAWLAKGERPRPGSIILVHPNGNEEAGINEFEKLYREGLVNHPLEPITVAPAPQTAQTDPGADARIDAR